MIFRIAAGSSNNLDSGGDIPLGLAFCIQFQYAVFNPQNILLMLRDGLGFEKRLSVAGDIHFEFSQLTAHGFGTGSVSAVVRLHSVLISFMAQVGIQSNSPVSICSRDPPNTSLRASRISRTDLVSQFSKIWAIAATFAGLSFFFAHPVSLFFV